MDCRHVESLSLSQTGQAPQRAAGISQFGARRVLAAGILASLAAVFSLAPHAYGQEQQGNGRSIVVDGWAVHGYAGNQMIGYVWRPTKELAEKDAAEMRKRTVTNGAKYYDKVDVVPEQRRISLPNAGNPPPPIQMPPPANKPAVKPPPPKDVAPPNLVGTTWVGHETLGGYGRLEFRFKADSRVEMIDTDGSVMGKWYQSGNKVSLVFHNGNCTYAGTINGDQIAGNALVARSGTQFTWKLKRQ
jgi:hypothetical protein